MTVLRSIVMAFSMFSTIRMPQIEWSERSMRFMLAAFPLVGVVIGLLEWAWMAIGMAFSFDRMVMGLGLLVIPLLVTGGIHIDGFADTVDALASHAPVEKKRQILKDPHVGSFAVIGIGAYLIAYFAFACQLDFSWGPGGTFTTMCVCLAPVLSRTMSGIASIAFPGSGGEGLLSTFRASASKRPALIALAIVAAGLLVYAFICISWVLGLFLVGCIALVSLYLFFMSRRQFGGMSGDLSGFYLQVLELAFLISFAIVERIVLG